MDKSMGDVLCGLHGFGSCCILRQWRRKFFHITTTFSQPMQNTDFRYVGKDSNLYVVTDGIRTKHLTGSEFRTFWTGKKSKGLNK